MDNFIKFLDKLSNSGNQSLIESVKSGYNAIYESIDYQEIYIPGDTVEIINNVYDYDTKDLMMKKGTRGVVGDMVNPEHVNIKLDDGRFIYVYVLDLKKVWDSPFKEGDRIEASKDIYDQTEFKVLIKRGDGGEIYEITDGDWVKVKWDDRDNPMGCHLSEICSPNNHKRN